MSHDKTVRLWPMSATRKGVVLTAHRDPVYAVAMSADEKRVASAGSSGMIRLWRI